MWHLSSCVFFALSRVMTGTVWNRAFLFIWNKLSEMLCRREWVQNDHQWFGKAMKLSFWRWMQKQCYNLLGRQGGLFSCSDWKLGCLDAAEYRQQRWAPDSWVRDGCKVGFRHRHGKIATAVCRKKQSYPVVCFGCSVVLESLAVIGNGLSPGWDNRSSQHQQQGTLAAAQCSLSLGHLPHISQSSGGSQPCPAAPFP